MILYGFRREPNKSPVRKAIVKSLYFAKRNDKNLEKVIRPKIKPEIKSKIIKFEFSKKLKCKILEIKLWRFSRI